MIKVYRKLATAFSIIITGMAFHVCTLHAIMSHHWTALTFAGDQYIYMS